LNPYAALLEVSQTGKGQRSAEQGYHRTGTEDGQITGRESGQAANCNVRMSCINEGMEALLSS